MRFRFLFRTLSSEERPRKSIVRRSDKSLHLSEPNGPAKIVVFAAGVEVPPRQWSGPAASVLGARATIGSASGKLPLGDARARAPWNYAARRCFFSVTLISLCRQLSALLYDVFFFSFLIPFLFYVGIGWKRRYPGPTLF